MIGKYLYFPLEDFPGGSAGKESACSVGDLGLISGLGRSSGEGNSCSYYLLQYSGLEKPMDCTARGCKESDTTEQLALLSSRKKNKVRLAMWTSAFRQ